MKSISSITDKINVQYFTNILGTKDAANEAYEILDKDTVYNSDAESMVFIMGKYIKIPRKQVGYGDKGTTYSFAGTTVTAKSWDDNSRLSKLLLRIKHKVELLCGAKFNFVLINRYENGDQYINFHTDDEKELGKTPVIAGVSFGAERDVLFKSIKGTEIMKPVQELLLEHGSLFVMYHPTNDYWKHSIPKRANINTPRISLTFRYIYDI
jgi:DNA oxidative demethylase